MNPRKVWVRFSDAVAALQQGRGQGVRIAVVDSGIEVGHPDLGGLKLRDDLHITQDALQVSTVPGDGTDLNGHGTAVAGIIRRLAPEAELGSFRVLDAATRSTTALVREGVRRALEAGYHILNCSFGSKIPEHLAIYKAWVDEAYLHGVHVVSACDNEDYTRREWPGHFPSVITVNYCQSDSGEVLYYQGGHLVEFLARGIDVEVAWKGGQRRKLTGSSFAAPHVTALLARLLAHFPELPPLQAKALLQELARPGRPERPGLSAAEPGTAGGDKAPERS
ncbi:MAG: S8 family serine peptidase [Verrucomicrobia bacterium]|nr:S8 family serine peptidase [Verrucomicrobiota bacterium]